MFILLPPRQPSQSLHFPLFFIFSGRRIHPHGRPLDDLDLAAEVTLPRGRLRDPGHALPGRRGERDRGAAARQLGVRVGRPRARPLQSLQTASTR